MLDEVTQVAQAIPDWTGFVQLGATGSVAAILLWTFLKDRRIQSRAFNSMSLSVLCLQQMLLIHGFRRQGSDDGTTDDCKKCNDSIESLRSVIEQQGRKLEELFRDDK